MTFKMSGFLFLSSLTSPLDGFFAAYDERKQWLFNQFNCTENIVAEMQLDKLKYTSNMIKQQLQSTIMKGSLMTSGTSNIAEHHWKSYEDTVHIMIFVWNIWVIGWVNLIFYFDFWHWRNLRCY